jgi:hypothetical protein
LRWRFAPPPLPRADKEAAAVGAARARTSRWCPGSCGEAQTWLPPLLEMGGEEESCIEDVENGTLLFELKCEILSRLLPLENWMEEGELFRGSLFLDNN